MATPQEELTLLKDVRTKLLSGRLVASIEFDGQKTTYAKTDLAQINQRIAALEAELASATRTRRAIGVTF